MDPFPGVFVDVVKYHESLMHLGTRYVSVFSFVFNLFNKDVFIQRLFYGFHIFSYEREYLIIARGTSHHYI